MPTVTIETIRGYSKTSFEEALENAIKEIRNVDPLFNDFKIIQIGKEVGGATGRDDYYVVIDQK